MVGQKPDAALHRHGFCAQREKRQLFGGQIRAGTDISARKNAETLKAHLDPGKIALVLRRCRSTVADGVAEIVEARAGHHGVQIHNAKRLSRLCIQKDVIELGVIMRNAERYLPGGKSVLDRCHLRFSRESKIDFRPHDRGAARSVAFDRFAEKAVAVGCIVEIRDGFVQLFCRKVREELRKRAKTDGGLIEILVRVRLLEADRPAHIIIYAPVFVRITDAGRAVLCPDERHDTARIVRFGTQKLRHRGNVVQKSLHVAESAVVDPLQNIPASGIGCREESGVDMPAAVVFTGDRRPVQPEGAQNTHFFRIHGQYFLCVFPVYFSQSVGRWQSFCKNCAGFFKKAKPIHRKAAGAENKSLRGYPARIRQHPVYRLLRSIPGAAPNDHGLTIVPGPPGSLQFSSRIFL